MKIIRNMLDRRRGFTDNNQGIVIMTVIFALIIIVGGVVLIWMLSQIIVPLIILIVAIIVVSIVVKWAFGIRAPEAIGKGVAAIEKAGVPYITKGAGWFEKLIGGRG